MVTWINETGTLGVLISYFVANITGDMALALLMLFIFIVVMIFVFRIPLEIGAILIMPLVLGLMAYNSYFAPIGGVIIFIIVAFIVKAWLSK